MPNASNTAPSLRCHRAVNFQSKKPALSSAFACLNGDGSFMEDLSDELRGAGMAFATPSATRCALSRWRHRKLVYDVRQPEFLVGSDSTARNRPRVKIPSRS